MKEFCVDLEITKELKENGYSKPCKYFYIKDPDTLKVLTELHTENECLNFKWIKNGRYYAPTSDEILKELKNFPI